MKTASNGLRGRIGYGWVLPGALALVLLSGCHTSPLRQARPATSLAPAGISANRGRPAWDNYDQGLAEAIYARWHQLMAVRSVPEDNGRVVLEFELFPDGNIENLTLLENTEGLVLASLCEKAVFDPAPYRRWPAAMASEFRGSRTFLIWFEFNERGAGYVSYEEKRSSLLAGRTGKTPTLLVLTYHGSANA